MGQLLIIQGTAAVEVKALFGKSLRAFESLCGLQPSDQVNSGTTAVAKFPKLKSRSCGIVRGARPDTWTSGAGSFFYQKRVGEAALGALSARLNGHAEASVSGLAGSLEDLDGMFVIAHHDGLSDEVQVITDRLGSLHVYRAVVDSCLVLSTSSMVIARLLRPRWDVVACREFLASGTVFEQRSLFEGIEKLGPATAFRFRDGREGGRLRYWNLPAVMYDRAPFSGDVPHLAAALQDVILLLSRNFKRPVLDLTGGFDSRSLAGAMLKAGVDFDTVVNGDEECADVLASKRIGREFGLRHRHQSRAANGNQHWWNAAKTSLALCDGEYDVLEYAGTFDIHTRLSSDFDATINGSNGEICRGYWWELLFPFTGWRGHFDDRRVARARFAVERETSLLDHPFPDDLTSHFEDVIRRANVGLEDHPNTAKMDNVYLTLRMQRWQGRISSATSRIWTCLSPFMFREPMETALSAPPSVRVRNRMTRRLIEYFNPRLAALPMAQGGPALPLRVGTVHLFTPLLTGASKELGKRLIEPLSQALLHRSANPCWLGNLCETEEVRELLNPATMVTRDLYNVSHLRRFLKAATAGVCSDGSHLGRVLTLELLARAVGM